MKVFWIYSELPANTTGQKQLKNACIGTA